MVSEDTPDTTRDARLEARVSAAQMSVLQHAAALSGRTLGEFVVTSAQDAARRVIAEHESIRLSREEQLAFVQALLQPPEPSARLKRAAKAYLRRGGQRASATKIGLCRALQARIRLRRLQQGLHEGQLFFKRQPDRLVLGDHLARCVLCAGDEELAQRSAGQRRRVLEQALLRR